MDAVLAAWGQPDMVGRLGGGNRNTVTEIHLNGRRFAARMSRRPAASLDWEVRLLDHLAAHGMRVPVAIPALDGRRHVDGVTVHVWIDGQPPGPADWSAVAAELRKLHDLTTDWPQRPGSASTAELLVAERGGDVDLSLMPADAVTACRRAWSGLAGTPQAVIHGDPGPANIGISAAGVGLLDWDEARVDYTDLDLAELPGSDLPPARRDAAQIAATAWEAANGWTIEPSYARRQLQLLLTGRHDFS